jgi:hypothetical protein
MITLPNEGFELILITYLKRTSKDENKLRSIFTHTGFQSAAPQFRDELLGEKKADAERPFAGATLAPSHIVLR